MAAKSALVAFSLVATAAAFAVGAEAGTMLEGRLMGMSVARLPMPAMNSPGASPVTGYMR